MLLEPGLGLGLQAGGAGPVVGLEGGFRVGPRGARGAPAQHPKLAILNHRNSRVGVIGPPR